MEIGSLRGLFENYCTNGRKVTLNTHEVPDHVHVIGWEQWGMSD